MTILSPLAILSSHAIRLEFWDIRDTIAGFNQKKVSDINKTSNKI